MVTFVVLLLVCLVAFGLSAWVFLKTLRGRRVGDHPHCGRCEFDLFGLLAESQRCPECGADLGLPGARLTGKREVNTAVLWTAAGVGGMSLLLMSAPLSSFLTTFDLSDYQPVYWLADDLRHPSEGARDRALNALRRRLTDDQHREAMTAEARAIISHHNRPSPAELEFLAAVGKKDWLTFNDLRMLMEKTIVFEAQVRPAVRAGDPIPIRITTPTPDWPVDLFRTGPMFYSQVASVTLRFADSDLEPIQLLMTRVEKVRTTWSAGRITPCNLAPRPPVGSMLTLRPGKHRVLLTLTLDHIASGGFASARRVFASTKHEFWQEIEILPADAVVITPVRDPEAARAASDGLRITLDTQSRGTIITFEARGPIPVTIAADVIHRINGIEYNLGTLLIPAGVNSLPGMPMQTRTTPFYRSPAVRNAVSPTTSPAATPTTKPNPGILILRPNPALILTDFDSRTYLDTELYFDLSQSPVIPILPN